MAASPKPSNPSPSTRFGWSLSNSSQLHWELPMPDSSYWCTGEVRFVGLGENAGSCLIPGLNCGSRERLEISDEESFAVFEQLSPTDFPDHLTGALQISQELYVVPCIGRPKRGSVTLQIPGQVFLSGHKVSLPLSSDKTK